MPVEKMAGRVAHRRGSGGAAARPGRRSVARGGGGGVDLRLPRGDHPLQLAHLPADGRRRPVLPRAWHGSTRVTHVPARSLWAQSLWAVVLTLSGSYSQLYTYAVLVDRALPRAGGRGRLRAAPHAGPTPPRPYRVWGYPWVPIAFLGRDGGAARQHGGRAPGRVARSDSDSWRSACRPTSGCGDPTRGQSAEKCGLDAAGKRDRDDPSRGAIRGVVGGAVIALVTGVSHQQPELDRIAEAVARRRDRTGCIRGARARSGRARPVRGRSPPARRRKRARKSIAA